MSVGREDLLELTFGGAHSKRPASCEELAMKNSKGEGTKMAERPKKGMESYRVILIEV